MASTFSKLPGDSPVTSGSSGRFPFNLSPRAVADGETVVKSPRSEAPSSTFVEPSEAASRLFPLPGAITSVEGMQIGEYTLESVLGRGGMGAVFLGVDDRLQRPVALKILAPSQGNDPAAVQRFRNEGRASARLDHENIARVYHCGEDQQLHFIAYEYVPGTNLRDLIRARGRIDLAEAVNYAIQLAAALSHTSKLGVVHRDIKPSNIIIGPTGRVKLVDLGLARNTEQEQSVDLTVSGTTLGTFDYISPEQARDPRSVDVRSDIYSLGCTLYHMLTGEPPYPEGTVLQKLLDHQGKSPDPATRNPNIPPALSAIVRKMMASDPKRRYATPDDLIRDLLQVARQLGLRAVPTETVIWSAVDAVGGSYWQQNLGWIATAVALVLVVVVLQTFPNLLSPPSSNVDLAARSVAEPTEEPAARQESRTENTARDVPGAAPAVPTTVTDQTIPTTSTPTAPRLTADSTTGTAPVLSAAEPVARAAEAGSNSFPPIPPPFSGEPKAVNSLPLDDLFRGPLFSDESMTRTPAANSSNTGTTTPSPVSAATTTSEMPSEGVLLVRTNKFYSSLEAACAEARDRDVIELTSGKVLQEKRAIRLVNKQLTLRAARGRDPVVEFLPDPYQTDAGASRLFSLGAGASLEVIDIEFRLQVPEAGSADRWAIFSVQAGDRLALRDVEAVLVNPRSRSAAIVEIRNATSTTAAGMDMMKNGSNPRPDGFEVSIDRCFLHGSGDAIALRDVTTARVMVQESVVAVSETLLDTVSPMELPSDSAGLSLELMQSTCFAGQGLIVSTAFDDRSEVTLPVKVTARNNLISLDPARPMVHMKSAAVYGDVRSRLLWNGDRNFYDQIEHFWQIDSGSGQMGTSILNFAQWKSIWNPSDPTGSENGPIYWSDPSWRGQDLATLSLHAFDLDLTLDVNPAIRAAADGRDAGAPLDELTFP
jgi:serine/threonine-protein kinase